MWGVPHFAQTHRSRAASKRSGADCGSTDGLASGRVSSRSLMRTSTADTLSLPPARFARAMSSRHASSGSSIDSMTSSMSDAEIIPLNPSEQSRYASPGSVISDRISTSTNSLVPRARVMMFLGIPAMTSSSRPGCDQRTSLTKEWSCVTCSISPCPMR